MVPAVAEEAGTSTASVLLRLAHLVAGRPADRHLDAQRAAHLQRMREHSPNEGDCQDLWMGAAPTQR